MPAAATAGAFSLLRIANPPGCWTPPHLHRNEEETVFVLGGALRVETEGRSRDVGRGEAVVLPRGRPHRLDNAGAEETRCLVLCTPGGLDSFVRAAGRPMPDGGPTIDEAGIARLMQAAPHHGIGLPPPGTLHPAASADAAAVHEAIDGPGIRFQLLAELGSGDDDPCPMPGAMPPGGIVPMHRRADHDVLYGLGGALEAWIGPAGDATWRAVGTGQVLGIPAGALRNRGDRTADMLLITTRRGAALFHEAGSTG